MHLKKNRLQVPYTYDFHLYGLLSGEKEYKLAWRLNELLDINFAKSDNIELKLKNGQLVEVSNFVDERDYSTFRLLKNRAVSEHPQPKFLFESLKHLDYFFLVKDKNDLVELDKVYSDLKGCPFIQLATVIDVDKLPNKENLIF